MKTLTKRRADAGYEQIADYFRTRIVSGHLAIGERLPSEYELAKGLKVSRNTVREALRLLASANLIETRRGVHGGAFVVHPGTDHVDDALKTAFGLMSMSGALSDEDIMEATRVFSPVIGKLAAERRTDEEAEELLVLAQPLPPEATDEDRVKAGEVFCSLLLKMTHNILFSILMNPIIWIVTVQFKDLRKKPGWWDQDAACRIALAQAIARRDVEAASGVSSEFLKLYSRRESTRRAYG